MARLRLVKCLSPEQYGLLCVRACSKNGIVPFLVNGLREGQIPLSSPIEINEEDEAKWRSLSWRARCNKIVDSRPSERSNQNKSEIPRVIAREGPACITASFVSSYFGFPFQLITESFPDFLECSNVNVGSRTLLVGLPEDFSDRCLFSELARFRDAVDHRLPWAKLPVFTLLSARDLESLTWLAAKWVITGDGSKKRSSEIAMYVPSGESSYASVTSLHGQVFTSKQSYSSDEFAVKAVEPIDLLSVATHGFEACADGGGGIVLCGLNSNLPHLPEGAPGVLACARGHDCPRGPQPIPLEKFRSSVLMLASCNGLRLADSVLQPHFNLGLSFIDGEGLAYVSSLFSSAGTTVASSVFSSAMASGLNFGQALSILNAFLYRSGLDHPAYVAIGNPQLTLRPLSVSRDEVTVRDGESLRIDVGNSNMSGIVIRSCTLAKLADEGQLCIRIEGLSDPVYWFSYPEDSERVRLFLFAFPHALPGVIEILFLNRSELEKSCEQAFQSLVYWSDFAEMTGSSSEFWDGIRKTEKELSAGLPSALQRCAYEAGTLDDLSGQITLLRELGLVARTDIIETLSEELLKTFWLSNSYAHRFKTERISVAQCQNCGDESVVRILRRPLRDDLRKCVVCPRCGITADIAVDDIISKGLILAPETVKRGEQWEFEIRLELKSPSPGRSAIVCPRLSANGWSKAVTEPSYAQVDFDESTTNSVRFSQIVGKEVPPHRYFLKVLIASEHEIAFASKVIYLI